MKRFRQDPRYLVLSRLYLRKALLYGAACLLLGVVQTTVLAPHAPLGVTPDLMLAFVVAIGFWDGERIGGVTGIAAGFLIDALGSTGLSLMPLCYLLIGYVSGLCAGKIFSKNFPSYMIYAMTASLVRGAITLIHLGLVVDQLNAPGRVILLFLCEFAACSLFAVPVYGMAKGLRTLSERTRHP